MRNALLKKERDNVGIFHTAEFYILWLQVSSTVIAIPFDRGMQILTPAQLQYRSMICVYICKLQCPDCHTIVTFQSLVFFKTV